MAQAAHKTDQDYWRPINPSVAQLVQSKPIVCPFCAAESPAEAQFCHSCGSILKERPVTSRESRFAYLLNIENLGKRLGLPLSSLFFFTLGIACMVAVVVVGLLYRADTLVDWQAIQIWRVEWLLGACAALLAAILLREKSSK